MFKAWCDDREFDADWFVVDMCGQDPELLESEALIYDHGVQPALRVLRTPTTVSRPLPGGGLQVSIDSPDAQFVLRFGAQGSSISAHCLEGPAAAIQFCECVAALFSTKLWRVRDMHSSNVPGPLGLPEHGYMFGRVVAREQSALQTILLAEHPVFGRALVLNGEIQVGEADVGPYSRALVNSGIRDDTKTVLILGGGDCGVLREVLTHPVDRVVMVELDPAVVAFCRKHMPEVMGDALDDPRAEIRYEDASAFADSSDEKFDLVICDLTEIPIGGLTIGDRIGSFCRALADHGRLATHADCWQPKGPHDAMPTVAAIKTLFADVQVEVHHFGSFRDHPWLFIGAGQKRQGAAR